MQNPGKKYTIENAAAHTLKLVEDLNWKLYDLMINMNHNFYYQLLTQIM